MPLAPSATPIESTRPLSPTVLAALSAALPADRISTDPADLAATGRDTWPLLTKEAMAGMPRHQADVVVRATDVDELRTVLTIASSTRTPVTVRALGSSVTGQPVPVRGGIVLDVSHLPAWFTVDEVSSTVTASASQPGGELEDALVARGLTLGHSPQSLYRSTVGGWLATLATGQFSSLYGGIEDLVVGYTVLLATGEQIRLSASPRAAMGPDLRRLFLGSEGTLAVITEVTLKVFPLPDTEIVDTVALPDVEAGLATLREIAVTGLRPWLVRLYDPDEARHVLRDSTVSTPVLFLGSRGSRRMAPAEFADLRDITARHGGRSLGPDGVTGWLGRRYDFSAVENRLAEPGGFAETIEVAHTWPHIGALHTELKRALAPLADEVLAHFSHLYPQGTSMYLILFGRAVDDAAAVAALREIWSTTMEIGLRHGAELSHHHGGGLARSPYTARSLGAAHQLLRTLKTALDPAGILNPGKLGLPAPTPTPSDPPLSEGNRR